MTLEEQLDRLDGRQERLVTAMTDLVAVVEQQRDLLVEMMAWLQEPPSTALPDTLKALVEAIQAQGKHLANLPDLVAQAVVAARAR